MWGIHVWTNHDKPLCTNHQLQKFIRFASSSMCDPTCLWADPGPLAVTVDLRKGDLLFLASQYIKIHRFRANTVGFLKQGYRGTPSYLRLWFSIDYKPSSYWGYPHLWKPQHPMPRIGVLPIAELRTDVAPAGEQKFSSQLHALKRQLDQRSWSFWRCLTRLNPLKQTNLDDSK